MDVVKCSNTRLTFGLAMKQSTTEPQTIEKDEPIKPKMNSCAKFYQNTQLIESSTLYTGQHTYNKRLFATLLTTIYWKHYLSLWSLKALSRIDKYFKQ